MSKKYLTEAHITNKREFVEKLYNNWSTTYDKEITENYYATPDRVALILKKLIVNKKINEVLHLHLHLHHFKKNYSLNKTPKVNSFIIFWTIVIDIL